MDSILDYNNMTGCFLCDSKNIVLIEQIETEIPIELESTEEENFTYYWKTICEEYDGKINNKKYKNIFIKCKDCNSIFKINKDDFKNSFLYKDGILFSRNEKFDEYNFVKNKNINCFNANCINKTKEKLLEMKKSFLIDLDINESYYIKKGCRYETDIFGYNFYNDNIENCPFKIDLMN